MSLIEIEGSLCRGDGHCVASCPSRILELPEGAAVPRLRAGAEESCIRCGHCVTVCPHGALQHEEIPLEQCPRIRPELVLSPEQAEQLLRSRRSIRVYRDRPVDQATLARLIDLAHYSPTGGNAQTVRWAVVRSSAAVTALSQHFIDMLTDMAAHQHPFTRAYPPTELIAEWQAGDDPVSRHAPALVLVGSPAAYPLGAADCTAALTYLDLAAPTLGLGTCWAGFLMMACLWWPPMKEAVAALLPPGYTCHGIMMVGYPKYRYQRLPPRLPAQVVWQS